ncbi:hypothetical protein MRX96_015908 [Rhipicephalus microplus]
MALLNARCKERHSTQHHFPVKRREPCGEDVVCSRRRDALPSLGPARLSGRISLARVYLIYTRHGERAGQRRVVRLQPPCEAKAPRPFGGGQPPCGGY